MKRFRSNILVAAGSISIMLLGCASNDGSSTAGIPQSPLGQSQDTTGQTSEIDLSRTTSSPEARALGNLNELAFVNLRGHENDPGPAGNDLHALVDKLIAGPWRYPQGMFWTYQKSTRPGDYYRSLGTGVLQVTRTSDDKLGAAGSIEIGGREQGKTKENLLSIVFQGPVRVVTAEQYKKLYGGSSREGQMYHFIATVQGNIYGTSMDDPSVMWEFNEAELDISASLGITPLKIHTSSSNVNLNPIFISIRESTAAFYLQQP